MFKAVGKINPRVQHGNDGSNGLISLFEVNYLIFKHTSTHTHRELPCGRECCAHDLILGTSSTDARLGGECPRGFFLSIIFGHTQMYGELPCWEEGVWGFFVVVVPMT